MTTSTLIFLGLRALHVLAAAVWIGSSVFLAVVVLPAIEGSGPAGGQVMTRLNVRNGPHMGIVANATVLSGVYLLWRFTGGFDGGVLATHAGLGFSIGGASGILALVVGAIIGRTAQALVDAATALGAVSEETARQTMVRRMEAVRARLKLLVRLVVTLQALALVLMALGHYI